MSDFLLGEARGGRVDFYLQVTLLCVKPQPLKVVEGFRWKNYYITPIFCDGKDLILRGTTSDLSKVRIGMRLICPV